jgi:SAM-dependent methyltransferase
MFSLGDAYDVFMGRWSRRLAPLLVKFAGVADGDDVLDVGAGTGSLTAAVAVAAPSSRIIGVDRSEPYVAIARTHHQSHRRLFQVGDAQHLPLRGASFDRVLSLLTLNFVPDPATALGEMIRVTRAGGTVAAAVWDYGEGMEMLRVFWDEAITLAAHADEKDERHMPLSRSGELGRLWGLHRLHTVVETSLTIETDFSSFADYWSPFLQQQGPAGAHVATLSASERAQLESKLRRRLLDERLDGPITLRARAWAVRGVVPSPA